MKNISLFYLAVALHCGTAKSAEPAPAKPMKAEYSLYAGDLGNEQAPTNDDRKLSVEVSGQAAKDIFDSIYPDSKVTCSDEKGKRLRRKAHLWCSFSPSQGYRCYFGFDLRTGASIGGASC